LPQDKSSELLMRQSLGCYRLASGIEEYYKQNAGKEVTRENLVQYLAAQKLLAKGAASQGYAGVRLGQPWPQKLEDWPGMTVAWTNEIPKGCFKGCLHILFIRDGHLHCLMIPPPKNWRDDRVRSDMVLPAKMNLRDPSDTYFLGFPGENK
jgi:hypothetical protein